MMSGFGPEGPPVNWDTCLLCGGPMTKDEERFRVEKDGKVGIGHRECPGGPVSLQTA